MKIMYLISCIILWICIALNIRQLRRNRQLSSDYVDAMTAAYKARENYEKLWQDLNEEREYFRNLREQEATVNEE